MHRVLTTLAIMAGVTVLMGGTAAFLLHATVQRQEAVITDRARDVLLVEDFVIASEHAARKSRSFLLTRNPRFLKERERTHAELERQLVLLGESVQSAEGRRLLARAESLQRQLRHKLDGLLERRAQGLGADEAGHLLETEVQPDRDALDATLAALRQHKEQLLEEARRESASAVSRAFLLLAVTLGAGLVLSCALGLLLVRTYQRLLAAAEFQQRVVAIVGHDVRSPLAAILASVSHALTRPGPGEPSTPLLARVLRSARRIEVLTKLLVDFTQARTASGLALAPEPGDVHALCAQVLEDARLQHPERELRHERQGDGQADFDHERLAQALANLVDNALRHGTEDGPVRLTSRSLNPSVVEISIHNPGPPIDPKLLPHIFEPFRHGQHPQDVVRESLGMGLFIVHEVVRAHGGRVEVASTGEAGTTFRVLLPRIPSSRALAEKARSSA